MVKAYQSKESQDLIGNRFLAGLNIIGDKVKQWQVKASDGKSVFGLDRELGGLWQNEVTCNVCHAVQGSFNWVLSRKVVYKGLEQIMIQVCTKYFQDDTVCKGLVKQMGDVVVPQITDMVLTAEYACSRLYGFCDSPVYATLNPQDYVKRMISEKPDIIRNNDYIDKLYAEIKTDKKERETINILHMSDLHLDLEYTVGNNKN